MTSDWKILIVTGPLDEDYLIAEIYYKGEEVADISVFGTILTIYSRKDKQPWILKIEEFLEVIEVAKRKLL